MIPTKDYIDFLVTAGKQSIETGNEYAPTIVAESKTGMNTYVLAGGGHPFDAVAHIAGEFVGINLKRISLTTDCYMTIGTPSDLSVRGTPTEMFQAGDPQASEALNIVIIDKDRKHPRCIYVPYKREGNSIVWGEVESRPTREAGGRMTALMQFVFDLSHKTEEQVRAEVEEEICPACEAQAVTSE